MWYILRMSKVPRLERPLHWVAHPSAICWRFRQERSMILVMVWAWCSWAAIRLRPSRGRARAQGSMPSGVRTAHKDVDLIHQRLKLAQQDYEVRYGHDD